MIEKQTQWINIKNGRTYVVDGMVRNCTNEQDGQQMIIYHEALKDVPYAREEKEFLSKFEKK